MSRGVGEGPDKAKNRLSTLISACREARAGYSAHFQPRVYTDNSAQDGADIGCFLHGWRANPEFYVTFLCINSRTSSSL